MPYTPIFRPQYPDPTTTQDWTNCTMSSGAMALDRHTLGKTQVWGGELRKHQSDQVGGTDLYDVRQAWTHYGQALDIRSGQGWAGVLLALKEGRGVIIQYTRGFIPSAYRAGVDPSFTGGHAAYINGILPNGNLDYADPLAGDNGFIELPPEYMKRAAEAMFSGVRFAVTRITKEDELHAVVEFHPFPEGERRWRVPAGETIRAYDPAYPNKVIKTMKFANASSASGSGKAYIRWYGIDPAPVPRGGPFLRVTNGTFAGLYIPMHNISVDDPAPVPPPVDDTPFGQAELDAAKAAGFVEGKVAGMSAGRAEGWAAARTDAIKRVGAMPTTPQ